MRALIPFLAAAALCGCVGGDDDMAGGVDADPNAPDADPNAPDAGPNAPDASDSCGLPDPSPSWVTGYQMDVVARLSGQAQISPGVTLGDRSSSGARAATRDFLEGALSDLGLSPQLHAYGTGTNVWATIPANVGSDPAVVLGAHFDSVSGSPGANDNATGVALVLAVARYLTEVPCRSRDVIVVFFDQEEIGLVGSEAFAAMLDGAGTPVASVHTVDQMGWDQDGDRAIELERPDSGLYQLYADAVAAAGLAIPLTQTQTGSTDHVSFRDRGFAAIGITEEYVSGDTTPHYHLPSDTYGTVSFPYLASTTELVDVVFGRLVYAGP